MIPDADILDAYQQSRPDGPEPFVLRFDGRYFIMTEFTWKGFSSHLKLADAYPGIGKDAEPVIELQTKIQFEKQIRAFLDSHETEGQPDRDSRI